MSYVYKRKGTAQEQVEHERQKLTHGLLAHRKAVAILSARIRAVRSHLETEIAQAIWDDVPLQTVAKAAGMTLAKVSSVGLAFEDLVPSGTSTQHHVESLRTLSQQAKNLEHGRKKLRIRQEQLVAKALQTGLIDNIWIAAVSGLTPERVEMLGEQRRQTKSP